MKANDKYIEIKRSVNGEYDEGDAFYFSTRIGNEIYFGSGHSGFKSWLDDLQRVYKKIGDSNIEILVVGNSGFEKEQISAIEKAIGKEIGIKWRL